MAVPDRRVDVRRLVLEALVIMASIMGAFALDRWWDARRDLAEERLTLEALQDEFLEAKAELERRLALHRRIEGSIQSTLSALRQARDRGTQFVTVPDTALVLVYITPTTQLALGALNGMLTSGRLGVLKDRELRTALSSLEHVLGELIEEEARALAHLHDHLDPVVRQRLDVSPFARNALTMALLEGNTAPGMERETRVPVDNEMLGVFAMRLWIVQHGIDEFPPLMEAVDTILRLIEGSPAR